MKLQRNVVYLTIIGSIASALIYAFCIFKWNPSPCSIWYKWNTYISNLTLGIWGSSIISFFIGIISYNECRKKDMETIIHAKRALFIHCSDYKEDNFVKWFDEYELLYQNLSDSLATIGFLFDPLRRRLFLKEYVDFYGDFIHLAEDKHFRIKNQIDNTDAKEISNIIIGYKTQRQENFSIQFSFNRLTDNMGIATKNITNIYQKNSLCILLLIVK